MPLPLQFGLRRLLLLTFLVAVWSALAFNYESFVQTPGWRMQAYMFATSGLTATVALTAASATRFVAGICHLMRRPLTSAGYEFVTPRIGWWTWYSGGVVLPLVVIDYYDNLWSDQFAEMTRGVKVAIFIAVGAILWIFLAWTLSILVLWIKAALWRCPACRQKFSGVSAWKWAVVCDYCHAPLTSDGSDARS